MTRRCRAWVVLALGAVLWMMAWAALRAEPALAQGLDNPTVESGADEDSGDLDAEDGDEALPIPGGFGFTLGQRFNPNDEVECRLTRHGLRSCPAEPRVPSPLFSRYFLDMDPLTGQVAQISATSSFTDRIDYEKARGRAVTLLSANYGQFLEHQGGLLLVRGATSVFLYGEENDTQSEYALTVLITDDAAYEAVVERLREAVQEP